MEVVHLKPGVFFLACTLSPDGNFLYYNQTDPANAGNSNIYAVPKNMGGGGSPYSFQKWE